VIALGSKKLENNSIAGCDLAGLHETLELSQRVGRAMAVRPGARIG
jgi:hypothetical protein